MAEGKGGPALLIIVCRELVPERKEEEEEGFGGESALYPGLILGKEGGSGAHS